MIKMLYSWQWTAALLLLVAVWLPEFTFLPAQIRASSVSWLSALLSLQNSSSSTPNTYSLRWVPAETEGRIAKVEVSGINEAILQSRVDWKRVLVVYADPESSTNSSDLPPMLGRYDTKSGLLSFEPQFALDPGITYRAEFHPGQLPGEHNRKAHPIVSLFRLPAVRAVPTTIVRQVFPTSQTVPENLLKFYIHFSAPMSRGHIYEHIHLRSDGGLEVELPFLEIDEELWDPTMTRLTLFIDPGRIKRGVRPLEEIGPALEAGRNYSLVIDSELKDAVGNPLQAVFEKYFRVVAADRDPPDPAHWKVQTPQAATRVPLVVTFPEPMDQALAQRAIHVAKSSGDPVEGNVALQDQERQWVFTPADPWSPGAYRLVVPTTLEDLAGNNIGKPFEVDLFEGIQRQLTTPTVKLPFDVR
jgi:Big-like domain-containing protein